MPRNVPALEAKAAVAELMSHDWKLRLARLCSDSTFRSRFLYVAPPRFPLEVADVFQRLVKDLQRGECR